MEGGKDKVTIKKVGQWSSDTVEGYFLQKRLGWGLLQRLLRGYRGRLVKNSLLIFPFK